MTDTTEKNPDTITITLPRALVERAKSRSYHAMLALVDAVLAAAATPEPAPADDSDHVPPGYWKPVGARQGWEIERRELALAILAAAATPEPTREATGERCPVCDCPDYASIERLATLTATLAARDEEIARLRADVERERKGQVWLANGLFEVAAALGIEEPSARPIAKVTLLAEDAAKVLRASAPPPALVEAVRRLGEARLATDAADEAWSKVLESDDDETPEGDVLRGAADAAFLAYKNAREAADNAARAWVAAERGSR